MSVDAFICPCILIVATCWPYICYNETTQWVSWEMHACSFTNHIFSIWTVHVIASWILPLLGSKFISPPCASYSTWTRGMYCGPSWGAWSFCDTLSCTKKGYRIRCVWGVCEICVCECKCVCACLIVCVRMYECVSVSVSVWVCECVCEREKFSMMANRHHTAHPTPHNFGHGRH